MKNDLEWGIKSLLMKKYPRKILEKFSLTLPTSKTLKFLNVKSLSHISGFSDLQMRGHKGDCAWIYGNGMFEGQKLGNEFRRFLRA